jgi:hypothetical protein
LEVGGEKKSSDEGVRTGKQKEEKEVKMDSDRERVTGGRW